MTKLVIFDFDGTIVDSKTAYYNSIIMHLSPLGFGQKSITEAIDLGLNLWDTLGKFVPSTLYRWWLKRKIMRDVSKEIKYIKKCHDAEHLKDIHIKKILVSNSLSEFVLPVLKHFKLKREFDEIYCADNFDNKTKFITEYLKKRKINPKECFYVGDRVADIILAKKTKCRSIVVYGRSSWSSRKELINAKPEFIIPDLALVKKIVER